MLQNCWQRDKTIVKWWDIHITEEHFELFWKSLAASIDDTKKIENSIFIITTYVRLS